jgi:NAD(P)-dependent dehydrogenase (short-subunit alcohol dehydrogenase family)
MTIAGKIVLVTGANRGIGQALVAEAPPRGARRVYAGTRQPLAHLDRRVTPLTLDVTNPAQIQAAVESVEALDPLIFDGVENGEEEIFPDPVSVSLAENWRGGAAKTLERQDAALAQAEPAAAA